MSPKSSGSSTAKPPKPDLAEHEEETRPLEDVLRQLLEAKPAVKPTEPPARRKSPED
jgi:hypothetical protein